MKFTHLKLGQRFRWHDAVFSKTGPLTAVAEADARTQMIPRSASILPIDGHSDMSVSGTALSADQVLAALEELSAHLERVAAAFESEQAAALRTAIDEGQARLRARLGISEQKSPGEQEPPGDEAPASSPKR